jgi:hypothetical protein
MAELQWLDDESHIQETVLEELEPKVRELFAQICELDCGCALLRFLDTHRHALMTIDDIAYHLIEPCRVVEMSLGAMRELGLARRVNVPGLALFGIAEDKEKQELLRGLCAWQERWQARFARVGRVVGGKHAPAEISSHRYVEEKPNRILRFGVFYPLSSRLWAATQVSITGSGEKLPNLA